MGFEPFLGQIVMFAGNFAPRGWALCNGQLYAIASNQALFSILGTTYGGDGRTTFAVPDLRGRYAMHPGTGPGLSNRSLGQVSGVENVTLNGLQIPSHSHAASSVATVNADGNEGNAASPDGGVWAKSGLGDPDYSSSAGSPVVMNTNAVQVTTQIGNAGGNQSHTNMPPFQCVNFIIALQGIFPSRS